GKARQGIRTVDCSQRCVVDRWITARLHHLRISNAAVAHDHEADDCGNGLGLSVESIRVPVLSNALANEFRILPEPVIAERRIRSNPYLPGSSLRAVHGARSRLTRPAENLVRRSGFLILLLLLRFFRLALKPIGDVDHVFARRWLLLLRFLLG